MKSVIIADDSPIILDAITEQIDSMNIFKSIITVNNGFELLKEFRKNPTDLLLVDIAMPQMSGFDVVKQIRASNENVKIIIISNFESDEIIVKSLLLGTNGFIPKVKFVRNIYVAIERIKQNYLYFTEEIINRAKNNTSYYLTGLECYEIESKLSKREYEVFKEVGGIGNCDEVCKKLEIARKTIDNHLEKIKRKLNLKSKQALYRISHLHYQVYCKKKINFKSIGKTTQKTFNLGGFTYLQ